MKKIIFAAFICTMPIFAKATDMCARDNVMVLAFDPQINCTSSGNNAAEWSWWAQFPYGRMAGDATCVSQTEVNEKSFAPGLSGVDANNEDRIFCYCRITHPVVSGWVFRHKTTSCKTQCPYLCSDKSGISLCITPSIRTSLFNSIGVSE